MTERVVFFVIKWAVISLIYFGLYLMARKFIGLGYSLDVPTLVFIAVASVPWRIASKLQDFKFADFKADEYEAESKRKLEAARLILKKSKEETP